MKTLATVFALAAGCATSQVDDGVFRIEGRSTADNVTHVVAASPTTGKRVVAKVRADGRFELAVEPGLPWIVTLADWTKVGKDMQVATLEAAGLDAFVPQGPGVLDFGDVTIRGARAHGTVDYLELIESLGVDHDTATRMGRTDDLALRYANPDIDNDGTIDALQHGHDFRLDIAGTFTLTTEGRAVTMSDLVAGTFANPSVRYGGTTIRALVPRAMDMNMASGALMFEQPFYGSALGDITPMVPPGTPIGAPEVKFGELGGVPQIGVVARAGQNPPSGTYELAFDNGRLTFSDVHVPSAATLDTGKDYVVPFVRIRATDASCTVDCSVAAVELDWRALTPAGWQPASAPESARLDVVAKLGGKTAALGANLDATTTSLAWRDMPVDSAGILDSELAYVRTSGICYVSVRYTSELGMTMTMAVANPACR